MKLLLNTLSRVKLLLENIRGSKNTIRYTCNRLERQIPLTSCKIFEEFNLLEGHPWSDTAKDAATTYYACLYGVVHLEQPRRILEVGTAFGMGTATLLKACQTVDLFISMDLGIYGDQLGASLNNLSLIHI